MSYLVYLNPIIIIPSYIALFVLYFLLSISFFGKENGNINLREYIKVVRYALPFFYTFFFIRFSFPEHVSGNNETFQLSIMTFIIYLFVVPWYEIVTELKADYVKDKDSYGFPSFYPMLLLVMLGMFYIFSLLPYHENKSKVELGEFAQMYITYIPLFVSGVMLLFFIFWLLKKAFHAIKDKTHSKEISKVFEPDRRLIAKNFNQLSSPKNRIQYVRWLEVESGSHLPEMYDENNTWPNDKRPYFPNDKASSLLAQLDGRWMKMN